MTIVNPQLSLGLPGLDRMIRGLIPGDNIVWEVDSVDDYAPFVRPYVEGALARGQKVIYFRFASHQPLVDDGRRVEVREVHPEGGFETFIAEIHKTIEKTGRGGYYIFDCLSELAVDWYSDQMLANFFMLTCPYLYDTEAIAYFSLLRNYHSSHATQPITETTQVFLDVYRHGGKLFVHPLKVQQRYSPTMYMLHAWEGEDFTPVRESATISEILTSVPWLHPESEHYRVGVWHRTFLHAEEVLAAVRRGEAPAEKTDDYFHRLVRMAISRDERVQGLVEKYLTLGDILEVGKRLIGTGLIGGKAVGMLLARSILKASSPRWAEILEPHDSFYIGSDVFYTYLVQNGIWWMRLKQKDPKAFLEGAERPRQRMLTGNFPPYIIRQFEEMLDYFGQSPIIVRSSSLLEDNFGNSFAGKYESVFCANQGPRHQRLQDFLAAVRTIYASTMSEKALIYRKQRGLLDRDEQMALLVQRVSGKMYGNLFFPQIAGVALSFNPYVWDKAIDPKAGMTRLVFGMGTRAVERSDDDYTRVVALNDPRRRPETDFKEVRQFSQRNVDVLDLTANQLLSRRFSDVISHVRQGELPLELLASRDKETDARAAEAGITDAFPWVLTFDGLFDRTGFVEDLREMMGILQEAYGCPVDVEFTANFFNGTYKINLVQCRPLQVRGGGAIMDAPRDLPAESKVIEAHGAVIGQAEIGRLDRIVYVVPDQYAQLPIRDRYSIARVIGEVCHASAGPRAPAILLAGPGRWGTTTPSLGVPVRFSDINTVSAICEIVAMSKDVVPDVSLGTHFFSEMIEMDILYFALFPGRAGAWCNDELLCGAVNRLADIAPGSAQWAHVVRVIDASDLPAGGQFVINANPLKQHVVCYVAGRQAAVEASS